MMKEKKGVRQFLFSTNEEVFLYCSNCGTIYTEEMIRCVYCKDKVIKLSRQILREWKTYDNSY